MSCEARGSKVSEVVRGPLKAHRSVHIHAHTRTHTQEHRRAHTRTQTHKDTALAVKPLGRVPLPFQVPTCRARPQADTPAPPPASGAGAYAPPTTTTVPCQSVSVLHGTSALWTCSPDFRWCPCPCTVHTSSMKADVCHSAVTDCHQLARGQALRGHAIPKCLT